MSDAADRRARLQRARLYLICGCRPGGRDLEAVLAPALAGGVDVFQLRDKQAPADELREAAETARSLTAAAGALLIVNDDPSLATATCADGVHVGQRDVAPARARELLGGDLLIGLSTHARGEIERAPLAGADYIGVGPVHATPTKPGRPAVGVGLVADAAAMTNLPFFAIGGLTHANAREVLDAGATRIAVVRAIAEARDPGGAAAQLRELLDRAEVLSGGAA